MAPPYRLPIALLLAFCSAPLACPAASPSPAALDAKARLVLHRIVTENRTFDRIHAAEVLITCGEGEAIRREFLGELPGSESAVYRVGVWRVLAETAPNARERAKWVGRIEHVSHLVGDTDRIRSIESLCKLRVRISGKTLEMMRQLGRERPEGDRPMPLWSLVLAGEPGALQRLADLAGSSVAQSRQLAAYALRWLKPSDPAVLARLAKAADSEPDSTVAYPFLVAAAVFDRADPARMDAWRGKLRHLPAGSTEDAHWEACQALLPYATAADLPAQAKLLDDPNTNARIGAAWTVLQITAGR